MANPWDEDVSYVTSLPDWQNGDEQARKAIARRVALAEKPYAAEDPEGYQGFTSALYAAAAAQRPLDQAHVRQELAATRPLSVLMAEQVESLREWARGRTVSAD